jgi:hypothetical protein
MQNVLRVDLESDQHPSSLRTNCGVGAAFQDHHYKSTVKFKKYRKPISNRRLTVRYSSIEEAAMNASKPTIDP